MRTGGSAVGDVESGRFRAADGWSEDDVDGAGRGRGERRAASVGLGKVREVETGKGDGDTRHR